MVEALRSSTVRVLRRGGHATEVARVSGLSVATPPCSYDQAEMLDLLGLRGDEFAEGIFARCGVRRRQLEISPRVLATTLQERTPATEEEHLRLATEAVDRLDLDPAEVGVVVSASYYSLGGPTLAHRLVDRYGFATDADKYHLVGVGCASAVPLFRLAGQALRDRPGQKALVVASESITGFLTKLEPGDGKAKVVGSALFGDGCGATVLSGGHDEPGPAVLATAVHQVPGTLDHVRFAVSGADSHMEISRELPWLAETGVRPLVETFLRGQGLALEAIDHWLLHPGGRGIVEGLQRGLGLSDEEIEPSLHVLSQHGNVGTPSAFFVLQATAERRRPTTGEY